MTTRQRIDAMREARLWGGQIIVPVIVAVAAIPEAREFVKRKYFEGKAKVQTLVSKFKKES